MKKDKKYFLQKITFLVLLIIFSLIVLAVPGCDSGGRSSTTKIESVSYSSNIWCGEEQKVTAKACGYCGTCMNGMDGTFKFFYPINTEIASYYMGDQGHNWDKLCWGPYSKSFSVSEPEGQKSFKITANLNNGCHCDGSSASIIRNFTCTDPNKKPIIDSIAIQNILPRTGSPSTTDVTIRNRFSNENKEKLRCYGEGSDPDGTIASYDFYLKYKSPSGTKLSMILNTHYTLNEKEILPDGTYYSDFELLLNIPVGSEIYCGMKLTDDKGASTTGESM